MNTSKAIATLLFCLLSLGMVPASAQSLIPKPRRVESGKGSFSLDDKTRVVAPADARSQEIAKFLREAISQHTGIAFAEQGSGRPIQLRFDPKVKGGEAYRLVVTPKRVTVDASTHKGLFWGVQTLRQLLPLERANTVAIPAIRIEDAPAFGYRGHMFDVGRHFFPVDFLKQQIDLLSYYKFNTFRWHLTEDQGWRIEIKKYPKLTEVGAWRTEADGTRYGGFYTQDQIRDVVEYARLRNIMVIPEIEMPGHSTAAIAAYPHLSCHKQPIAVTAVWGVHKDIYCAGDETTFAFLQDVLDEVIALFPAPYVHIGGDEVPKYQWQACASCQQRIHDEGLKDEHELQSYFIKRIQRYLAGKGKTLIGWDEILEGGADRNAIIEVWRGDAEGAKALANGNRIISAGPFYFDYPTKSLTLEQVYNTELLADPTHAAHRELVLGAEAPLWTERITTLNAQAMSFPRLQALSELLWNYDGRDYADFKQRLQAHYRLMDAWKIAYGPEDRNVVEYSMTWNPERQRWQLRADRAFADMVVRYTTDGSEPDATSPIFTEQVEFDQPGVVRLVATRNGRPYYRSTYTLRANQAVGKPVTYAAPPSPKYSRAGALALVDGMVGSDSFNDGVWVGWQGAALDATIDLQQATRFHSIGVRFMQQGPSWILLPKAVRLSVSSDGARWKQVQATRIEIDPLSDKMFTRDIEFVSAKPIDARYIRVEAEPYGPLPVGHNGAGDEAWIFADEIIIH